MHTGNQDPSAAFLAQFSLNPAQDAFVGCGERFSFYVGGVGAGKTLAGAVRALARAIEQPGSLGLIGAPTYPMLRDSTQRTLFELLENLTPYPLPDAGRGTKAGGSASGEHRVRSRPQSRRAAPLPVGEGVGGEVLPYTYNKSEGHLTLANGSEILLRSLDEPDRVRGLNLAWFWLDEAPLCGYYAWQILKGRLRQQGYETAGWATGTPHGRDGFARDFEIERKAHHVLFRASTHDNAANLPEDYIADLGYSGALYDQEVLGLFTAFEGLVYAFQADADGHIRELTSLNAEDAEEDAEGAEKREETQRTQRFAKERKRGDVTTEITETTERKRETHEQRADTSGEPLADAGPHIEAETPAPSLSSLDSVSSVSSVVSVVRLWKSVIGGIDWGYTNPTAAVVFGIDGDGRAWQLDEWYQRRAPLDGVVLPAICELTRRYGVATWYCGPDEPEHIAALAAALIREGLQSRAVAANDAVRPGIQTLTRLLARREDGTRGLYVAPRCVHTIAEYLSYQYETSASGPFPGREAGRRLGSPSVSELPLKQNDHALDATRYALHTALGQSQATEAYLRAYLAPRKRPER